MDEEEKISPKSGEITCRFNYHDVMIKEINANGFMRSRGLQLMQITRILPLLEVTNRTVSIVMHICLL